jgi:hypothetical protein
LSGGDGGRVLEVADSNGCAGGVGLAVAELSGVVVSSGPDVGVLGHGELVGSARGDGVDTVQCFIDLKPIQALKNPSRIEKMRFSQS